jgi:hypothetical protein
MSGSEFVEMIVAVGAAPVRDLFKQARERAPPIIFHRRAGRHRWARRQMAIGGSTEQEQTRNQPHRRKDRRCSRGRGNSPDDAVERGGGGFAPAANGSGRTPWLQTPGARGWTDVTSGRRLRP